MSNSDDEPESLDSIKVEIDGVEKSWHDFVEMAELLLGESTEVSLANGEVFSMPGDAVRILFHLHDRERKGWTDRFSAAASADTARDLVERVLELPPKQPTLARVATSEGVWGEMFRALFARAGIDQGHPANQATLHLGPRTHSEEFHAWVYQELLSGMAGHGNDPAKQGFVRNLERVRDRLTMSVALR